MPEAPRRALSSSPSLFLFAGASLIACTGSITGERGTGEDPDVPGGEQQVLADPFPVSVSLSTSASPVRASRFLWGTNLSVYLDPDVFAPAVIEELGINMIRFPDGCEADYYDWKQSRVLYATSSDGATIEKDVLSVDEARAFASSQRAVLLYTVNMDSRDLPNPCGGWSRHHAALPQPERKQILIDEAVEVITSKNLHYVELGNEPWGSWSADDYVGDAIDFARAIKAARPTTRIAMAGHPTTGNNQSTDSTAGPSGKDQEWTARIQEALASEECGGEPCFDFVTDHPYSWTGYDPRATNLTANYPGMGADFPVANYSWIFPKRVDDYAGAGVALTEWNLKCWPVGEPSDVATENPTFDGGLDGWGFWERHPGSGHRLSSVDAHGGTGAVELAIDQPVGAALDTVQTAQSFEVGSGRRVTAYAWAKSDAPRYGHLLLQQTNPGPHQWHAIATSDLANLEPGAWQEAAVSGTTFADTTEVQVVLRVQKPADAWTIDPGPAVVLFDDVIVEDHTGYSPRVASVKTVEHGYYLFESIMQMATSGIAFANQFTLGTHSCGLLSSTSTLDASGQTFSFSSLGRQFDSPIASFDVLDVDVDGPTRITPARSCLAPGCLAAEAEIPVVSGYGFKWPGASSIYYLFLANRSAEATASVSVALGDIPAWKIKRANVDELHAPAGDYTATHFDVRPTETLDIDGWPLEMQLAPASITRVELRFVRQWSLTTEIVCADGQSPEALEDLRLSVIRWPRAGDEPHQLDRVVHEPAASPGAIVESDDDVSSIYVALETADTQESLVPADDLPHEAIEGASFFSPPTPMVRWRSSELPAGAYSLPFESPEAWCP